MLRDYIRISGVQGANKVLSFIPSSPPSRYTRAHPRPRHFSSTDVSPNFRKLPRTHPRISKSKMSVAPRILSALAVVFVILAAVNATPVPVCNNLPPSAPLSDHLLTFSHFDHFDSACRYLRNCKHERVESLVSGK